MSADQLIVLALVLSAGGYLLARFVRRRRAGSCQCDGCGVPRGHRSEK